MRRGRGQCLARDGPLGWLPVPSKVASYLLSPSYCVLHQNGDILGQKDKRQAPAGTDCGSGELSSVCRRTQGVPPAPVTAVALTRCGAGTLCLQAAHGPKSSVPLGRRGINLRFSMNRGLLLNRVLSINRSS